VGVSFLNRLRSWWNRDKVERAGEETRMTSSERDVAEEDLEARKDDLFVKEHLPEADFERDSEPPSQP
jgi:hypothetical protein